jgi:release factor glutamine methyltransferase
MKITELLSKIQGEFKISPFRILKILSKIEDKDISFFLKDSEVEISHQTFDFLLKHLKEGYPIEYITKKVLFLGNEFFVDENVLIPRIETEDLVILAVNLIKNKNIKHVIDIGTGSGVIAISIKKQLPKIKVQASDISEAAIKVAQYNAQRLGVNVEFKIGDCLDPFLKDIEEVELIISNPPYVETSFIEQNRFLKYEPRISLDGGYDGQSFFKKISKYSHLLKSKYLLFETSEFTVKKTAEILSTIGKVQILPDSFKKERFIFISPHY